MAHVLAKLAGAKLTDVKRQLESDAAAHAEQGMVLEHLWKNADDPEEILFLFRVDNLDNCKQQMNEVHAQARGQDPNAKLPQLIFLADA
jgi:hypothetical protein